MRLLRRAIPAALVLAACLLAGAAPARADAPEIFPLAKVKRGLKGYGMTTFSGTTPERFEFEVVGIARNMLPDLDIILVKSDDPKLQVSGFWQGMSGSPLYVDGKVMCAFSYGWRFNKIPLGGCTPLESMLEEAAKPPRGSPDVVDTRAPARPGAARSGKQAGAPATVAPQVATVDDWARLTPRSDLGEALGSLGPARGNWLLAAPLPPPRASAPAPGDADDDVMTASLPLALAGFDRATADLLGELFAGYGLEPRRGGGTGGGAAAATGPTTFTMGGSIAVELIRGDMSIASTGTVSYIDGDRVLAFGHPMFQTGETYAPVATSEVLGVVPSAMSAFVMAEPLREAGALVQDRQSMILADTRLRHPMIPVDIYLSAGEGKAAEKIEFHVEIWNNKFFTASLAMAAASNAIGTYLPDREHATARIESLVEVRGAEPLRFVDYAYANDGAASLIGGARALRVLVPLLMNPWTPVNIERIELRVDLAFRPDYGDIKEVRLPAAELRPGKAYELEVVLETFGRPDTVEKVPFTGPASLAGQLVTLEVSAGDSARLDAAPIVDLPSLLAAVRKLLPGNVWAVSLYGAEEGAAKDGVAVADLPASALDRLRPQTSTQRTDAYRAIARTTSPARRVINGSVAVSVKIAAASR